MISKFFIKGEFKMFFFLRTRQKISIMFTIINMSTIRILFIWGTILELIQKKIIIRYRHLVCGISTRFDQWNLLLFTDLSHCFYLTRNREFHWKTCPHRYVQWMQIILLRNSKSIIYFVAYENMLERTDLHIEFSSIKKSILKGFTLH